MAPSRSYREGMPYMLVVSSSDSEYNSPDNSKVRVQLSDGFWEDCPRLLRLEMRSFHMNAEDDINEVSSIDGLFVTSNLRVRNYIASSTFANLGVLGHVVVKGTDNSDHIIQDVPSASIIVERPQNGQSIEINLIRSDTGLSADSINDWSATFNLHPILETDTLH